MDIAFRWLRRALWLCGGLGFPFVANAIQPPEKWCEAGSGNTYASGCVSGTFTGQGPSAQSAFDSAIDRKMAIETANDPTHPRSKTGTATFTDGGAQVNGSQPITWFNGVQQANGSIAAQVFPICPVVAGSRAIPTKVSMYVYTCPGDNACSVKTGQAGTANFTIGWTRKSGDSPGVDQASDIVGGLNFNPGSGCIDGCTVSVGAQAGPAWFGTSPASTGLYRISGDFVTTITGAVCSPSAGDASNPNSAPKPCDGYQGIVGGVNTCVAPSPSPAGSAPPANPVNGNPKGGSDGAKPVGDPSRSPPGGGGGAGGGPPGPNDGKPRNTTGGNAPPSSGGGAGVPQPGTGASGGGTSGTGNDGKNTEGGACERNPSAEGCGGSTAAQPDLYAKKTATFGQALNAFKDQVAGSPLGTATGSFFNVAGGGTCPTFQAHIPFINADLVIDQFCSEFAGNAMLLLKAALMVVAGIAAFRIAVL